MKEEISGKTIQVGIIGCGNISSIYCKNLKRFPFLDFVACSDIDMDRARARAAEFGIPKACTVEEVLADKKIKIIVNLTIPKPHASVAMAAVRAGKSVYNEKPLTITKEDGKKLLAAAKAKKVRVGCAPDTFLGAGIQTCRKLIDEGKIGKPVSATAFMMCHGHEGWHPDPEFYYQVGGGPMLDMGPYYLTALIALMGPIRRITGSARITFPTRTITSKPKFGKKIKVEVPTHIAGVMDFVNGAVGTIITSFDVWSHHLPCIEIYGTEGSLRVPDPNTFGGPISLRSSTDKEWQEVPLAFPYGENFRGLGVADMAMGLLKKRTHRANGDMAFHVLECMHAFGEASKKNKHMAIRSVCKQPAPLAQGLTEGVVE